MPQQLFDYYTWKARVQPALIVAVPAALVALVWFPKETIALPALGTVLVWGAVGTLVSQLVRDAGARRQVTLFQEWDGVPTTRLLRHRGNADARLLELRHRKLEEVTGLELPSAADEERDPAAADSIYEACTERLRETTRDHQLVFQENCNYGFRRNLLALKPLALVILLVSIALSGASLWRELAAVSVWLSIGVEVLLLVVWLLVVTPAWVRRSANRYAHQLLTAAESLRREV